MAGKDITHKRRQQLTRQLLNSFLGEKKTDGHTALPGLLQKMVNKLEKDLDSNDPDIYQPAIDRLLKLVPFVISKEKGPPLTLINAPGAKISTGKNTQVVMQTINNYLDNRTKQVQGKHAIVEAEYIEKTTGLDMEVGGESEEETEEVGQSIADEMGIDFE